MRGDSHPPDAGVGRNQDNSCVPGRELANIEHVRKP